MLIDLFDALRAVVSFRDHFHFNLRTFNGISLAYHRTERAVTAEVGVSCHQ